MKFLGWAAAAAIGTGLIASAAAQGTAPASVPTEITLARMEIPGSPEFVRTVKDILDVKFSMDASNASGNGLFEDAVRVPSYSPAAVLALGARLQRDIDDLKSMPWRRWSVDQQIDWRWMLAWAEEARRELVVERLYAHRPAEWLEATANNLIALLTYAPERFDLRERIESMIPGMVDEMRAVASSPTARDVATADGVIRGILGMLRAERANSGRDRAAAALAAYAEELKARRDLPQYAVIGADNYAWRLRHALLLPWTPEELVARAQSELRRVDAEMAELRPAVSTSTLKTAADQETLAKAMTRESLLGLYDEVVREDRAAVESEDWVTISTAVGLIHARETPDPMVPLTGDGGSMNPPPTFNSSDVGYWNVEHFHADWPLAKREEIVAEARNFRRTTLGPYAAHEGIPGHHLQLSVARLISDPLRSIAADCVQNEGWAVYAEERFQRAGGLGPSAEARYNTLASWRHRIMRVIYDSNIETGRWTLQQGADFEQDAAPGKGTVDEDVMRSINWPTQLICYFSGKMEILELREAYRRKTYAEYSDRRFHDALLSVGSVPIVFARAKLLGEPVPDPD